MSDSSLRSDYFFLEEVLDRMPRDAKRAKTQHQTSRKCRRLLQQCEKRNIDLKLMPTMMERHKKNNSWFCAKRDAIMWKVEVILHPSKKPSFSFQLCEDDGDILSIIQKHAEKHDVSVSDDIRLFVKQQPAPTNKQRFAEIGVIDNLRSFLIGKTVIEHPTIYCVNSDNASKFPTAGSDKIKEIANGNSDVVVVGSSDNKGELEKIAVVSEKEQEDGKMMAGEPKENGDSITNFNESPAMETT